MGKNSGIEWTDHTWNPWYGCQKVSPGCKHCYAERDMQRHGRDFNTVTRASTVFDAPLRWQDRAFVFTCSWSDFFIEKADEWRDEAWEIIRKTPHLTYQILTKRPDNIHSRLPEDWGEGYPNVWLGTSIESHAQRFRADELLRYKAAKHFLSMEPLLGPVDIQAYLIHDNGSPGDRIDWVIAGGESGSGFRNCKADWIRKIQLSCQLEGVPFFFKQWGGTSRIDGVWGGNELDGKTYEEMPSV